MVTLILTEMKKNWTVWLTTVWALQLKSDTVDAGQNDQLHTICSTNWNLVNIPYCHQFLTKQFLYQQRFIGMIYENSNESSGMQKVLEEIHGEYVPHTESSENEVFYSKTGVVGDQGSVERGVNVLLQLRNGFTTGERLGGLHMELADFYTGMKFLQVNIFKKWGGGFIK